MNCVKCSMTERLPSWEHSCVLMLSCYVDFFLLFATGFITPVNKDYQNSRSKLKLKKTNRMLNPNKLTRKPKPTLSESLCIAVVYTTAQKRFGWYIFPRISSRKSSLLRCCLLEGKARLYIGHAILSILYTTLSTYASHHTRKAPTLQFENKNQNSIISTAMEQSMYIVSSDLRGHWRVIWAAPAVAWGHLSPALILV